VIRSQTPIIKKTLLRWTLGGIVAIIPTGVAIHYLYSWTKGSLIISLVAPVNESVWEHLKLGYWAVVLFSIIEYPQLKEIRNYFVAKCAGVISLEATILIIYYSYTSLTHENILWMDILSFIAGVVVCQFLTYYVFRLNAFSKRIIHASVILFICLGVIFATTTFFTPHYPIFKDHNSNSFGIAVEK